MNPQSTKRLAVLSVVALVLSALSLDLSVNAQPRKTADEILRTMTDTMSPEQSHGKMKMTIVTSTGQERTFLYETFSKNEGEKSLMKYLKPRRVKGQAILMLNDGDDIWTYFPRTKRIRKLATHARKQKVQGSDFSYADMGGSDTFIEKYQAVRHDDEEREGRECYKLELTRKPESSASYSRLVLWVDIEYLLPLVIDYYHDDDRELWEKQLILSDIRLIDNIHTPMKYVMYNKLDNTHTAMEVVEVTYKVDLPDDLFTEMGMQK